ncbi:hypothetical protein AGDE_15981 [Angomonas deanei]|uniref:DNA ligase N terminus/ATP dependent DNA ligase domain containing protein, putative n=1 Tax=Angomonas deanei TaxID=59799 RepID=A0A7G2CMF0_9TRYP|nr:hypothetical protein AGDE_15981 [Angomonas deanei]CAD2220599.1 DNA ligase N terminus/ATP dependent DNA ligase domain containing protein, putative [Angomonas deanei]|eukprot:EPY17988.1 hypothetical protein AGDE_15981 [Angomonas deanei]
MSIPSTVKCFGQLCEQVTNEPSLTIKEEIIRGFVSRFSGNLTLLAKLLLPKYANRIYYAQEKQLIRVLSVVLCVPEDDLKTEWNKNGCVAETAQKFFKPTASVDSSGWCKMTLDTFDEYLNKMAAASTETNRIDVVTDFLKHACGKTVYLFFRELKQDMRLGAGLRIVLAGLHPNAYQIFQHTANLEQVVEQIKKADTVTKTGSTGQVITRGVVSAQIKLGVPLAPMLAAPSKSIDYVLSKCPNGAFSEVKYDGERIQIHKQNGVLSFFARSIKANAACQVRWPGKVHQRSGGGG